MALCVCVCVCVWLGVLTRFRHEQNLLRLAALGPVGGGLLLRRDSLEHGQLPHGVLVDIEQANRGAVVLHDPHLGRQAHDSRHREVQTPARRLLLLAQIRVHHAHQLHRVLLLAALEVAGLAANEERIDLAVVAANRDAPRARIVLLDRFHVRQELADAHVVVRVPRDQELAGNLDVGGAGAELGDELEALVEQLRGGQGLQVQLEQFDPGLEFGDEEEDVDRGGGQLVVEVLLEFAPGQQVVGVVEDGEKGADSLVLAVGQVGGLRVVGSVGSVGSVGVGGGARVARVVAAGRDA